jgi:hypothetical protein
MAITRARSGPRLVTNYQPTFLEDLPAPDPTVAQACGTVKACLLDALISGLLGVGVDTQQNKQNAQKSVVINSEFH